MRIDDSKILTILVDIKDELFNMGHINKKEYKAITKFLNFVINDEFAGEDHD